MAYLALFSFLSFFHTCFLFWAAAPKGPMTYAFTHKGNFSFFFFSFSVCPLRLKLQPQGSNHSLEAQITASWLKSQAHGSNHSLEAQIPLLMLKFNPRASKLTKHRSSAPSGPLPISPSHTHIYSKRGNGYRIDCFLGSGPEGADDLCFHTGEISPPSPSPSSPYPPPLPAFSPHPSLEAQIPASRPKSQP